MSVCTNCNLIIKTGSTSIQCNGCQGPIHTSGVGLSDKGVVTTRAKSRSIKVVCNLCNNNIAQFNDLKALLLSIKNDFNVAFNELRQEFETKLTAIRTDVEEKVVSAVDFDEMVAEVEDRQRRKK